MLPSTEDIVIVKIIEGGRNEGKLLLPRDLERVSVLTTNVNQNKYLKTF